MAVFIIFAITFLKEKMAWNYAVSFALLIAAVIVAFAFRTGAAVGTLKFGTGARTMDPCATGSP